VTVLLLVKCGGLWPRPGREVCPAYRTVPADVRAGEAYERLTAEGWEFGIDRILCPAHARARSEERLDGDARVVR
jgi:hypothetical protein